MSDQGGAAALQGITEHMEVVGSDGQKIGTVDRVAGETIILTKSDPEAGGHHHSIPASWVQTVDRQVTVSKTAEEARDAWRDRDTDEPYGSDNTAGEDGPHNLNRAFPGTYE